LEKREAEEKGRKEIRIEERREERASGKEALQEAVISVLS